MTYEEAIRILRTEHIGDTEHMELAKHMGANALEKQTTPKKPVYNCNRRALCPVCDGELYPKFLYVRRFKHQEVRIIEQTPYCKHCGQALDWGKLE